MNIHICMNTSTVKYSFLLVKSHNILRINGIKSHIDTLELFLDKSMLFIYE